MSRVKTFAYSGSLLPGDLNAIEDDYETGFSTWKTIDERGVSITNVTAGLAAPATIDGAQSTGSTVPPAQGALYFDPADYAVAPRTCKMRLRGFLSCNQTAPGMAVTANLAAATITHSASGNQDAMAPGSTQVSIAFGSVAASSLTRLASSEFTPTAGLYVVTLTTPSTLPTGNVLAARFQIQVRAI